MGSFATSWAAGDVVDAADLNTIAGAWDSFTVTLTNATLGSGGTSTGFYKKIGRLIVYRVQVTFGTSPSITGEIRIDLPVTAASVVGVHQILLQDASPATSYPGTPSLTTTYVGLRAMNSAGTYASATATSSTIPFTWAVDDQIRLAGVYEAAS